MRNIRNPYLKMGNNPSHCFGCSPFNENGLHLQFQDTGDEVITNWTPSAMFEGYTGIVHGGILATLLDEVSMWFIYTKCNTAGVTSEMAIQYLRPVRIGNGNIVASARLSEKNKNLITLACSIVDELGNTCCTGKFTFFVFPEEIARTKFHYPGVESFYE